MVKFPAAVARIFNLADYRTKAGPVKVAIFALNFQFIIGLRSDYCDQRFNDSSTGIQVDLSTK